MRNPGKGRRAIGLIFVVLLSGLISDADRGL